MSRRARSRVPGARATEALLAALEKSYELDRTGEHEDDDPYWEEFIERSLRVRDLFRKLTPRWRRELHPMVREGVAATVDLAELMVMRRIKLRLDEVQELEPEERLAAYRAQMVVLERQGPFMGQQREAKRRSVLAAAEEAQILIAEELVSVPAGLSVLDGAVSAAASHRALDR